MARNITALRIFGAAFGAAVIAAPAAADVQLSFAGTVDVVIGYTVGGVAAPVGSPFTLDVDIDTSAAASGRYAVTGVSYTLTVGTYTTVTDWSTEVELVATDSGGAVALVSDPILADPGEDFLLNLSGFGPSAIDDPMTWGSAGLTGDVIVRGVGGVLSPDKLSGAGPYSGTLDLIVTPAPGSIALVGLGGLVGLRRRRSFDR